ncbi:L-lysine 6-monooxygenase mbtG domain protein [Mycobacterium kansasii]|uniref:L-lysine 6-monooxygenase mbtG domain protein n=1 Tax=Mycobacterium kansasii TaxID=1768 RepID=A0A1V3XJ93_MYCKA|nr:L-lysine 6-monooxygenase mbtG domain protein [Mycobacterium kansasii]
MNTMLAVVGAGAKAVAVAAKAATLRDMGIEVGDVVAVERAGVAANWRAGAAGRTAGSGWAQARKRTSASRIGRRWFQGAMPNSTNE